MHHCEDTKASQRKKDQYLKHRETLTNGYVIVEKETVKGQDDADSIDIGSLRILAGAMCGICSLYTAWPNCCGAVWDGDVTCLQGKATCCKPSNKEDVWCIFADAECMCRKPTTALGCKRSSSALILVVHSHAMTRFHAYMVRVALFCATDGLANQVAVKP